MGILQVILFGAFIANFIFYFKEKDEIKAIEYLMSTLFAVILLVLFSIHAEIKKTETMIKKVSDVVAVQNSKKIHKVQEK